MQTIIQWATLGKGQGSHMSPKSKDKIQRAKHTMQEGISEEIHNSPLETTAGQQTSPPDRTPTSPREADGEFFLLRFSSAKRSWRARRPIFSTCSAGGRRSRRTQLLTKPFHCREQNARHGPAAPPRSAVPSEC